MPVAFCKGTFRQQLVADREIPGEMSQWLIARTLNRFESCFKYVRGRRMWPRNAAGHTKKGQREGVGTARWPFHGSKPV